jgi:hypothetical protein
MIIAIEEKKVYRFNECLREWETRFDEFFFVSLTIPKDDKGNLDITPIIELGKQREAEIKRRDDIYRTQPFSVVSYSVASGVEISDLILHLAQQGLPIRCCTGTNEEQSAAFRAIQNVKTWVLDGSAIATLYLTRSYVHLGALKRAGLKFIVPRSLFVQVRARIETDLRFSGNGPLADANSQIIVSPPKDDRPATWIEECEALIKALEENATIVDGLPLAAISPNLRDELTTLFGWDNAEAIAIADSLHCGLWTDDFIVHRISLNEHNTPRVWTELLLLWTVQQQAIDEEVVLQTSSKLIQLGYQHTRLTHEIAAKMGEDSGWDYRREPLVSAIRWLANPGVNAIGIGAVAEGILPRIYRGGNELISSVTVQRVLSSIGGRPDGVSIIKELRRRIGLVCGYDVLTGDRLIQDIEMWLRHNPEM